MNDEVSSRSNALACVTIIVDVVNDEVSSRSNILACVTIGS